MEKEKDDVLVPDCIAKAQGTLARQGGMLAQLEDVQGGVLIGFIVNLTQIRVIWEEGTSVK